MKYIQLPDFMGKSQGNVHCAPPLLIQHSCEHCLQITLNCLPVQSYHNSTANFRVHASVTFLVNGDERPLLMGCFLKHLEMSPFHWRGFRKCTINRLNHTFPQTQNVFTYGALIPSINLFSLQLHGCNLLFGKLRRNLYLLHAFCAHAKHFQEQICVFPSSVHVQHIQKWLQQVPAQKLQLLSGKIRKAMFCMLLFHE